MMCEFRRLWGALWWKWCPGLKIKVRWPLEPEHGTADPNAAYRTWLETHVGRQRVDWDWSLEDNDLSDNTLTIKFRKGRIDMASVAMLKWG